MKYKLNPLSFEKQIFIFIMWAIGLPIAIMFAATGCVVRTPREFREFLLDIIFNERVSSTLKRIEKSF